MIDKFKNRLISDSVYSVGNVSLINNFQLNAYLIVDEVAGLINSSSYMDVNYLIENIEKIISSDKLKYIVVSSLDIKVVSGLIILLKKYPNIEIVTSKNYESSLKTLIESQNFYFFEEHNYTFNISEDTFLSFIPTPYLNNYDSFVVYYSKDKILFSDMFFSAQLNKYQLFADSSYIDDFRKFHEQYFYDKNLIKSTMKKIFNNDIKIIAPLIGSVIKSGVKDFFNLIKVLRTSKVLKEENPTTPDEQLDNPDFSQENIILNQKNDYLEKKVKELEEFLIKNKLTGLYNGKYFTDFLKSSIKNDLKDKKNYSIIFIDIDNLAKINFDYGNDSGDEILKNVALLLKDLLKTDHHVYKLKGAAYAYFLKTESDDPKEYSEIIRNNISNSNRFIDQITVSIAFVRYSELQDLYDSFDDEGLVDEVISRAYTRLKLVKSLGKNIVFDDSMLKKIIKNSIGNILICDYDVYNARLLKKELTKKFYNAIFTNDGEDALNIIKKENVELIFSSIMLNRIDGFQLKDELNKFSSFKNIPFIIIDFNKTEDSIKRVYSLSVDHFLEKPVYLEEIIQLAEKYVSKAGENND